MDIHPIDGSLLRMVVPTGTVTVRAFVNGTPVGKGIRVAEPTGSAPPPHEFTVDVRLDEIASTAMCESLPCPINEGVLLQVYAFDRVGQTITSAELAAVQLPTRRTTTSAPRSMASADQNRLVATAMHNCGDVHAWEFPIRHLVQNSRTEDDGGRGLITVYLRALFDADPLLFGSGVPIGAVTWSHTPTTSTTIPLSKKRQRMPPSVAWGEHRCTTMIHQCCTESVFIATLPPSSLDGVIRCEVSTAVEVHYLTLGGLRYAVYGRTLPNGTGHDHVPPLLGSGIEEEDEVVDAAVAVPTPQPLGKRLAVLVGVSKYSRRRNNDLEWADDDAVTWYEYLSARGYQSALRFPASERSADRNASSWAMNSRRTPAGTDRPP